MKKTNLLAWCLVAIFGLTTFNAAAQKADIDLKTIKTVKTTDSKALKRQSSCWSNAGTALLEAEWLRTGKPETDIAVMDFVHNAYLLKAQVYLDSDGKTKVNEVSPAIDVMKLAKVYGFVPETAYMYPQQDLMSPNTAEMDAMLRGTLAMVQQKENGNFTEKWQNTYNTTLMRYIGESKIGFDYNGNNYTPVSFAQYSGLNFDDYILVTSDVRSDINAKYDLQMAQNWGSYKFFNVVINGLNQTISNAIENDYAVLWYGNLDENAMVGDDLAIVSAGDKENPTAEKEVSADMRQEAFEKNIAKEQDYLLIFGISKDEEGRTFYQAKKACEAGNQIVILSEAYVNFNTIYLTINKNALPAAIRSGLGL
jgi:bleomycin hydrolase